ncbi:MAG TPA: D-glycerate dehydrogenase, partial [Anaeromyxobacteraceae bacterium]|nr:D-glycerate dehydrogenase [Anaeromyxobacteraceae bacterium]
MTAVYVVRRLPSDPFDALGARGTVAVLGNRPRPPARDALVAEAREADVLVPTYLDRVDASLLDALPRVRLVASYGVGTNHLDLEACRRRGVTVTNTPDVLTDATADHAMALLLAAARRVVEGDRLIRRGGWTENDPGFFLGTHVSGKTLGLVGFGRIGQAVARRARGFDLRVLYVSPREIDFPGARRVSLDALLRESDFVSLHVPLTPETDGLLGAEAIARMKPGAILVNTARGHVVDDGALAGALRSGRLGAA